jgi:hypothetical protein
MTDDESIAGRLDELARQVRWLRHVTERLLAVLGILCGAGMAVIVAKIILAIAG